MNLAAKLARVRERIGAWGGLGATAADFLKLAFIAVLRNRLIGGEGGRCLRRRVWLGLGALRGNRLLLDLGRPDQIRVFEEIFLERVYDLEAVGFEPDLVVDCGAHAGFFTLLAASRFPRARVLAFEPHPANWRHAREQVAENALNADVVKAAVGVEDGAANLVGEGCGGCLSSGASSSAIPVNVISLPRMLAERAPARLLLKMDIEGGERTLLPVLVPRLPEQTMVFFETHGGTAAWEECRTCLEATGFRVRAVRSRDDAGVADAYVDGVAGRG